MVYFIRKYASVSLSFLGLFLVSGIFARNVSADTFNGNLNCTYCSPSPVYSPVDLNENGLFDLYQSFLQQAAQSSGSNKHAEKKYHESVYKPFSNSSYFPHVYAPSADSDKPYTLDAVLNSYLYPHSSAHQSVAVPAAPKYVTSTDIPQVQKSAAVPAPEVQIEIKKAEPKKTNPFNSMEKLAAKADNTRVEINRKGISKKSQLKPFSNSNLKLTDINSSNFENFVQEIENAPETEKLVTVAMESAKKAPIITRRGRQRSISGLSEKRKKSINESLRLCFRYVKESLNISGLVPEGDPGTRSDGLLEGEHASQAQKILPKAGFINLLASPFVRSKIKSPDDAPRGSILVYRGGPSGHIEIKVGERGQGGYVSDYYSVNARTGDHLNGRGRQLVGIFVKPDVIAD